MKHITLWRVGLVRCIALLIAGSALHGIMHAARTGFQWNIQAMSLPTAMALLLIAIAIYVLGYRTERDYNEILELYEAKGRVHGSSAAGHDDTNRDGQGRNRAQHL